MSIGQLHLSSIVSIIYNLCYYLYPSIIYRSISLSVYHVSLCPSSARLSVTCHLWQGFKPRRDTQVPPGTVGDGDSLEVFVVVRTGGEGTGAPGVEWVGTGDDAGDIPPWRMVWP